MRFLFISALFCLLSFLSLSAQEEARLLRFPAIHNDQIVFTYAGDLYTVPAEGGLARRLTSHDGFEMFPRFSPDGSQLAFTAQYDGNTEIYVMPARGGSPQRLTYTATLGRDDIADRMGPNNITMGWKNDNRKIVFRSRMRSFNSFNGSLFTVDLDGNLPEQIPVPRGGFCSFSPDDSKMAFNRIFREFRTWKRYRGGMADDIWIYDFESKSTENITGNDALDIIPMWSGQRIYFLSDRGEAKRLNLYVYDLENKTTRRLTDFQEFDIKFPSLGPAAIVFENGGYIYHFDLESEAVKKVPIKIAQDFPDSRKKITRVDDQITNYEIAPDGQRALFGARGEIFTVPLKRGVTRNLTQSAGIHERNSKWSPDGQWIAFISDQSGEDEIYIIKQDGSQAPIRITSSAETYKYQILWSPDSKKLLWSDRRQRLRFADIRTKVITDVDQSPIREIRQYNWAPDSRWITYSKPLNRSINQVVIYELQTGRKITVTDSWYSAGNPAFGSDGKYLFFTSNRDFSPRYSWTEGNHAYFDMSRIYLVTLDKTSESPFHPKSDEVQLKKPEQEKKAETAAVTVKVDAEGIQERTIGLPVQPSNYFSLASVGDKVYFQRRGLKDDRSRLILYDLDKQKETDLGQINGYEISADQKKMLVGQNNSYAIIDLPSTEISISEKLDLSGMEMRLDRKAEWEQIYHESWRQMREFFYAPNMHGVDWPAVREKYAVLLPHVRHRNDLTYVIGEMIGELNAGHAYVGGGERPQPAVVKTGLLGAELTKDPASGYFKIIKILPGQNWNSALQSPLQAVGINASEGDYILSVNGQSTKELTNFFTALVNTVGKQVNLTINSRPDLAGSRKVTVIPIEDESGLYYYNWVSENIEKVNKATNGKVGYIHIPDMGSGGLNEFVKYYYPQLDKKALIIDVRGNGGGFVSAQIIERLRREIAMIAIARNGVPAVEPYGTLYGPMVCLADEFSASDGDIFPYRFKKYGLGKVIGKRTWGGVVGIRGSLPLLDGGQLFKPEFSRFDVEGSEWIMEGVGVEPDIEVDNDPAQEFAGDDQQLNKAIQVILEELESSEMELPAIPPYPDKR